MVGASLVGGNTGYYVPILSPDFDHPHKNAHLKLLMMPLGFATNHPLIPINVALYYGVASSVLRRPALWSRCP